MASSPSQALPGTRSRRSYPSLNQISVAPLTPHYPIDDENDPDRRPQDYFSPRNEAADTPTRTSYLSSFSVPGTPGVLSRTPSRSGSRARHHTRSKSSTFHLSDTSLQEQNVVQPLYHHSRSTPSGLASAGSRSNRRHLAHQHHHSEARDPEWMLRAGIALATSAREEKGQSWLVKRESSTSLVSDGKYEVDAVSQSLRSGLRSRPRSSGRSTPAGALSRSRAASRRNSRPDLAMTGLEMSMPLPISKQSSFHTPSASVPRTPSHLTNEEAGSQSSQALLPDFIDERVRAEMRDTLQQHAEGDYDSAISDASWDSEDDSEYEEIDERELQRLTRERGFGLGSWVDRMVEWTLFGVDDWPLSTISENVPSSQPPQADSAEEAHDRDGEDELENGNENRRPSATSLSDKDIDNDNDENKSLSDTKSEIIPPEQAGDRGGWEDAGWFLRTIKQALVSI
ncbi:DUF3984 domain-containing protein [Aspergillus undulatus]|uniref:DUF3984 domain-containing protein n=1 Tax=Aspergillus undulatus TaxID=1810928 RepID=UPI003CCE3DC6